MLSKSDKFENKQWEALTFRRGRNQIWLIYNKSFTQDEGKTKKCTNNEI